MTRQVMYFPVLGLGQPIVLSCESLTINGHRLSPCSASFAAIEYVSSVPEKLANKGGLIQKNVYKMWIGMAPPFS